MKKVKKMHIQALEFEGLFHEHNLLEKQLFEDLQYYRFQMKAMVNFGKLNLQPNITE